VDAQAAQVKQLEGTVKVDQAQVDNARLNLSYTRITAPLSGRLGLRQVDSGNMVRGSDDDGIAIITQVDPITVLFTIPQDNLPRVITRLKAGEKPGVEAWDREQKNLLARGTLITIDNQIDVQTGTVRLKAEFPNGEGKLYPNQFVNVRMTVDTRTGVVVIPSAGIQRGAQGTVVYVVKEDNSVTLRPVVVGPTEGLLTAIESGVNAGRSRRHRRHRSHPRRLARRSDRGHADRRAAHRAAEGREVAGVKARASGRARVAKEGARRARARAGKRARPMPPRSPRSPRSAMPP
jgi:multidrug efflux system membrane fusion protein